MSTPNQRRPLVALALLPASLISLSVHAQDGTATLEEIFVTAQKREQSLQDVPISMTAMGPGELAAGGYHQLRDVQFSVPNLVFGSNQAQSETFIGVRGVGDFA